MTNKTKFDYKSHEEIPEAIRLYLTSHFRADTIISLPIEDINEYLNMYWKEWPWEDSGVEQGF